MRRRPKAPAWTDPNIHDPGITLVQLFGFLAETLRYLLGAQGRRAARRRKLAVAAFVLLALWLVRANRGE